MKPRAAFGLSILMSLASSIVVAVLFVWPWLRVLIGGAKFRFQTSKLLL